MTYQSMHADDLEHERNLLLAHWKLLQAVRNTMDAGDLSEATREALTLAQEAIDDGMKELDQAVRAIDDETNFRAERADERANMQWIASSAIRGL